MSDFNQVAAPVPEQPKTTTVRALQNELGNFVNALKDSREKLKLEAANIEKAKSEIAEELTDSVKEFVGATLAELNGDQFSVLADISSNTPEITGQSLTFARKKLIDARDAALETVNKSLDNTVDAEGFQAVLSAAETRLDAAFDATATAKGAVASAETAIESWRKTPEYDFVMLDKDLVSKGGAGLTADNRAQYEPTGIFAKVWRWLTAGNDYKAVRKALKEYGHGQNGRDAFASMAKFKAQDADGQARLAQAQAGFATAQAAQKEAQATVTKFTGAKNSILTDAEILDAVRAKVVTYFNTPEFVAKVAAHYAEDFPRQIPLLTAKVATLDKLQAGVDTKLEGINKEVIANSEAYRKLSKARPGSTLNYDLDAIQKRNAWARLQNDNFTSAAHQSWTRTQSYAPPSTIVYVDNSPSFFEEMLIIDALSNERRYDHYHQHDAFVPSPVSPYTADLFNINRNDAPQYNLPPAVFDTSPELAQQMADIGVDAAPGQVFDIPQADDTAVSTFDTELDAAIESAPAQQDSVWDRPSAGYDNDRSDQGFISNSGTSPS